MGFTIMINKGAFKAATYTTNISETLLKTVSISLCLSISITYLVVEMNSATIYFLQMSSLASNLMFALLKARKDISRTIFILVLASKKVFLKNQTLLRPSANWIKEQIYGIRCRG